MVCLYALLRITGCISGMLELARSYKSTTTICSPVIPLLCLTTDASLWAHQMTRNYWCGSLEFQCPSNTSQNRECTGIVGCVLCEWHTVGVVSLSLLTNQLKNIKELNCVIIFVPLLFYFVLLHFIWLTFFYFLLLHIFLQYSFCQFASIGSVLCWTIYGQHDRFIYVWWASKTTAKENVSGSQQFWICLPNILQSKWEVYYLWRWTWKTSFLGMENYQGKYLHPCSHLNDCKGKHELVRFLVLLDCVEKNVFEGFSCFMFVLLLFVGV